MPSLEIIIAGIMMVSLIFYALLAGADFGGGVWDLLASGPRTNQQRALIAGAIGPIWEANHVWLILVIVLLFTAFPPAFVAIMTALHIPLTIMLIGIVLRGAAFTFRTYDSQADAVQRRWSRVFAIASVVTPIMLGVCIGAIASGSISVRNGIVTSGFFAAWLAPFPWAVGMFALVLFAFLAAVYLTVEAPEEALREDFRRRALGAAVAVGVLALLVFLLSGAGAPRIRAGLVASPWAWPLQIGTAVAAVGGIASLWARRYPLARALAAAQVSLILLGWGAGQYPYLVEPDITIASAAAPTVTLRLLLIALGAGALLLFPSLYFLYRVF
jgi:cytochrome d ubiquinol oxidase subunit II